MSTGFSASGSFSSIGRIGRVLRSWTWRHTALGLGIAVLHIVIGPAGGLLLWPVPEASKQYERALLMYTLMFGWPMVLAFRLADAHVRHGGRPWRAYGLAVAGVAIGGAWLAQLVGLSVWGGQPANLARTAWLALGVGTLHGLGVGVLLLARHSRQALAQAHEAQAAEAARECDLQLQWLEELQARVDPALLFDTLGRIQSRVTTDPAAAEALLTELIALLRALPTSHDGAGRSVAAEFELLRAHAAVRAWAPSTLQADAQAAASALPAMLALPMLACWHAAAGPGASPRVTAQRQGARLRLRMEPVAASGQATIDAAALQPLQAFLSRLHGPGAWLNTGPGPWLELELPTTDAHRPDR